jgi:hypothetical protein
MGRVILQSLSRIESDETHESQRNKDATDTRDACDTPSVCVPACISIISVLDSQSCATHATQIILCGTAEISTQSQFGLL